MVLVHRSPAPNLQSCPARAELHRILTGLREATYHPATGRAARSFQRLGETSWIKLQESTPALIQLAEGNGDATGLIAVAGRGEYSHAAKAAWWDDDLFCLEMCGGPADGR